jgi:hypothetical protein
MCRFHTAAATNAIGAVDTLIPRRHLTIRYTGLTFNRYGMTQAYVAQNRQRAPWPMR